MIQQDSTNVTWTQVYNDVKGALQGAADAMKVGAEHVYEVLVKQQFVNSITYTLGFILAGLVSYFLLRKGFAELKIARANPAKDRWGTVCVNVEKIEIILPIAAGGIIAFVSFIVFALEFDTVITGFLNPEYGAIQEIKSLIR